MKTKITTILTLSLFLLFGFGNSLAQESGDYRSAASGDWSVATNWETFDGSDWVDATSAPVGDETITILTDHSISVDANIEISGYVTVEGDGPDAGPPFDGGLLEVSTGSLVFRDGSVYEHARDGGSMPVADWWGGSTVQMTGILTDDPDNTNQSFYHFIWNNPNQVENINVGWDQTVIGGDVTVLSTGGNQFRMTSSTDHTREITIEGSVIVDGENAEFTTTGSGDLADYEVTVMGDVEVINDGFLSASRGSSGRALWFLHGDLTVDNARLGDSDDHDQERSFIFAGDETQLAAVSNVSYDGGVHFEVAAGSDVEIPAGSEFVFEETFLVEDGGHVGINGRFVKTENGQVFLDGSMDVNDGGFYVHARDAEADVPDANWNEGSTIEFTGLIDDDPSGANRDFYNVIFDNPDQISNFDVGWGHQHNEILGDVIVRNTGGNQLRMTWAGRYDEDIHINIAGDVIVEGENSELTTTGSGSLQSYFVNVGGDVIVRDGGHLAPSRGSSGMAVWNIHGDFTVEGGTLDDSDDHDQRESFAFVADTLAGSEPAHNIFVQDISYDGPVHFKVADSSGVNILANSEFIVEESFINEGIAEVEADGELIFADESVYEHAQDGGNVPTATWQEGSTALFNSIVTSGPGNASQDFYNLVLNSPDNIENNDFDMDGNTIHGDIEVLSTGSARLYLTNPDSFEDREITIMGDIYVDAAGGAFTTQGTGSGESSVTVHHHGSITVDNGNFSIGRGSGPIVTWYMYEGDFIFNNGETQNSNPRSGSAFVFSGSHRQVLDVSTDVNIQHLPVIVPEGGYLDVMESEIGGSDIFQLADGGILATSHPDGFEAIDPDETSFSSEASYILNGSERQQTSFTMPLTVDTLTIDNDAGVDQSRDITINGALKLLNGEFNNEFALNFGTEASVIIENGFLVNPVDLTHEYVDAETAADQEGFDDYFQVVEVEDEDFSYIEATTDAPDQDEAPEDGHITYNTSLVGDVNIWLLINMPDGDGDSFFIQYDENDMGPWWFNYEDHDEDFGTWVWAKYEDLSATVPPQYVATGDNDLILTRREAGAKLDQILFTTDLNYEPEDPEDRAEILPTSSDEEELADVPEKTELRQNYPNPFNPVTNIEYALKADQHVTIEVYNAIGQRIKTLVNSQQSAGNHTINFDATDLPSGMYIYRLQAEDVVETRKMMLVK